MESDKVEHLRKTTPPLKQIKLTKIDTFFFLIWKLIQNFQQVKFCLLRKRASIWLLVRDCCGVFTYPSSPIPQHSGGKYSIVTSVLGADYWFQIHTDHVYFYQESAQRLTIIILFKKFYWNIVDLQCCIIFKYASN